MPICTNGSASTEHLPEALVNLCLGKESAPLNPHSQRLLSAAARKPKVDSRDPAAEPADGKGQKRENTDTEGSRPEAKAKASCKVRPKPTSEDQGAAKNVYSEAKAKFMELFLAFS